MQSFTFFVNNLWSILSIIAQVLAIGLVIGCFSRSVADSSPGRFFREHALAVSFVVSLLAMIGSLTYSNIIGYPPCVLCWYQRIAMYPQVALFGIAMVRKDPWMKLYGIVLSLIGAVIALYHYIGQLGFTTLHCDANGVSCAQRVVFQYGYITIPVMALSAFVLIAMTCIISLRRDHEASVE